MVQLLLLSCYIEENPGATTRSSNTQSNQIVHASPTTLEPGHAATLAEKKAINIRLISTEQTLADSVARIAKTEEECELLPYMRSDVDVPLSPSAQTSESIAGIGERLNDAEDWSRRCNLVFHDISDCESESWCDSEKIVTDICNESLKIALQPKDIQRAHRIGKMLVTKIAPLLLFYFVQDQQRNLSKAFKLMGTTVSISEDFCAATRSINGELIRFARE